MCEFHDSHYNGLGDMWWTDKCIYFSIIDNLGGLHKMPVTSIRHVSAAT